MTYDELVAAIQSYTENQFPDTYLADGSAVSSTTQIEDRKSTRLNSSH